MPKNGKKFAAAVAQVEDRLYSLEEAIPLAQTGRSRCWRASGTTITVPTPERAILADDALTGLQRSM